MANTLYITVINKAEGTESIRTVDFIEWNKKTHWVKTGKDTGFRLKDGDNAFAVTAEGKTILHLFTTKD
jgi:hypothetical protein